MKHGPLSPAVSSGALFLPSWFAFLTQRWIERRERRNRRDDLRLGVYTEAIDLIIENEKAMSEAGDGTENSPFGPLDLQIRQRNISHRLKLLAPTSVQEAYRSYAKLVFQEMQPVGERPRNPDDVVRAREALIDAMARDFRS